MPVHLLDWELLEPKLEQKFIITAIPRPYAKLSHLASVKVIIVHRHLAIHDRLPTENGPRECACHASQSQWHVHVKFCRDRTRPAEVAASCPTDPTRNVKEDEEWNDHATLDRAIRKHTWKSVLFPAQAITVG